MTQTVVCPGCHGHVHVIVPDAPDQTVWRTFVFFLMFLNLVAAGYVALFVYDVAHPFG